MNGTKILGDETTSLVFDRMGKAAICRAIDESLSAEKSDKRDGLIRRACSAWKSNALRDGEMLAILRVLSPERYEAIKNLYDIDYAKMGSRPGNLDWDRVVEHLKKNGPSLEGIYAIAVYGYLEGVFPRVDFNHLVGAANPPMNRKIRGLSEEELDKLLLDTIRRANEHSA